MIECRKTAEERKNYFESMERHMFARGSTVKETGRESISTSQEQVSCVKFKENNKYSPMMTDETDGNLMKPKIIFTGIIS